MTQSMELAQELLLEQYVAAQHELETQDIVPGVKQRASRAKLFAILGAFHLALLVACLVTFANFIVINKVFHIIPS